MSIIAIIVTVILEQRRLLNKLRNWFVHLLQQYVALFSQRNLNTQRQIRYSYVLACLPIIVLLLVCKITLVHHQVIYISLNSLLFMLSVNILSWKEEAKNSQVNQEHYPFIQTYATRFFATVFWFILLPSAIGAICYLLILIISHNLKHQAKDSLVYNQVVDKMLFYVNLPPYLILYLIIATAGDFEEVIHYLVEQKQNFSKSFYFLENLLSEVVLIAIGKNKFMNSTNDANDDLVIDLQQSQHINPKIVDHIVALLYRSGLIFLLLLTIICIANLLK